jgi:alpha-galactosidase
VARLARRLAEAWDSGASVDATTDRAQALPGADFVVLAVAADREREWRHDHELARARGVWHYAENGGPGGFAHACRSLALILPIVADVERLAPGARLICLSNPLRRVCAAAARLAKAPMVGLCDGPGIGFFVIATALHRELGIELPDDPRFLWRDDRIEAFEHYQEIARARYRFAAAGINHFTWITSLHDRETGEDVLPLLRRRMTELPAAFEPLTQALFRLYGQVPVQGDTHVSEYLPFAARSAGWRRYDIQQFDFDWAQARRAQTLNWMAEAASGRAPIDHLLDVHTDGIEGIVDAIANDRPARLQAVNVPNRGFIPNLPDGAIVEVPATVDGDGIAGERVEPLREPIAAWCRTALTIDELVVEAFLERDRDLVRQLFALDPIVGDLDLACELADVYAERAFST